MDPSVTWSWHVQSRNTAGQWGPWSATWTFTTKSSGGGGCVLEGTLVALADGRFVPVENLAKGTSIISVDLSTGDLISETVTLNKMTVVSEIEILNDGLLALTLEDQPIYVRNGSFTGWIRDPQDLQIGWDVFNPLDGSWITITKITFDEGKFKVYEVGATGPNNFIGNGILLDAKQP